MVCSRCKYVVKTELEKLGLHPLAVELGEVDFPMYLSKAELYNIEDRLKKFGFELIDDKRSLMIEKMKSVIIELVHELDAKLNIKLSEYLSNKLNQEYSLLSKLFSEVEDVTIEKYFINQKIERVKELLIYDQLSLSEIAHKLNYSSVSYLSNQFKKITGFSPSHYKNLRDQKRTQLDLI